MAQGRNPNTLFPYTLKEDRDRPKEDGPDGQSTAWMKNVSHGTWEQLLNLSRIEMDAGDENNPNVQFLQQMNGAQITLLLVNCLERFDNFWVPDDSGTMVKKDVPAHTKHNPNTAARKEFLDWLTAEQKLELAVRIGRGSTFKEKEEKNSDSPQPSPSPGTAAPETSPDAVATAA